MQICENQWNSTNPKRSRGNEWAQRTRPTLSHKDVFWEGRERTLNSSLRTIGPRPRAHPKSQGRLLRGSGTSGPRAKAPPKSQRRVLRGLGSKKHHWRHKDADTSKKAPFTSERAPFTSEKKPYRFYKRKNSIYKQKKLSSSPSP